jgi:hypothetical protein
MGEPFLTVQPCQTPPEVRMLARLLAATSAIVVASLILHSARGEVTVDKSADKITVKIDGKLFTEYLTNSGSKPILWPIVGPSGTLMTRSYPMKKAPGEATDHVHQRSFWFTHGNVNGIDFWSEGAKAGKQIHKEFVQVEGGKQAVIVTRNDWVAPDGKKLLDDERRLAFSTSGDNRVIDFDITLTAGDEPVTFGDTKEGSFGIRITESARVDRGPGRILNSEGQIDNASNLKKTQTWGKRASWVDYSGPMKDAEGKEHLAGIAILNHPSSFRFPTYWHVRTYGLFAANPFGIRDFEGRGAEEGAGNHTLKPGERMILKYRVIFHAGMGEAEQFKKAFDEYAADAN